MSRYTFIAACTEPWPVQVLCCLLAVSLAGHYQWRQRPASPVATRQPTAQVAFTRHARRYGTRRLRAESHAEGHAVGRYALRSWLRSWLRGQGLRALSTRTQHSRTTVADPAAVVAEPATRPASAHGARPSLGRRHYLSTLGGRALVPTELVLLALKQALTLRQPAPGLITHDDRGSQYTSTACHARID